ncbi:dUTP diphosphatase [Paraburkholderia sp. C35]|uniref:dUTP diphosphatase n=1 Tax=Paraburkholderia sp. C35 TaxID=2126993 RepID=UPI001EF44BCD|nr:dUTP diphosphatase [Paraburkholderia sp. C35]
MTQLRIKRLHPDAQIPQFATAGAACIDLHAIEADSFKPHPTDMHACIFRTGLAVEIPSGYVLKIYSRSGQGFKDAVRLSNCVGVIDSDYRGEIMVSLRADGDDSKAVYKVRDGDRIAQAMLEYAPPFEIIEVGELSETARGAGGFGSTGKGAVPENDVLAGDDCADMLRGTPYEASMEALALAQKWEKRGVIVTIGRTKDHVNGGDRPHAQACPKGSKFHAELPLTKSPEASDGAWPTAAAVPAQTAVLDMVQYTRDDESIQTALMLVGDIKEVPLDVIATWTLEQCIQVHDWALAVHMQASDNDDVVVPPRPAVLDAYEMTDEERCDSYRIV